jgi:hypothetical protein
MTPLEERVALEQRALEGLWQASGLLEDVVPVLRRLEDAPRVAALLEALEGLWDLTEGVEGWTACESCGRLVVPIVDGAADVECEDCE